MSQDAFQVPATVDFDTFSGLRAKGEAFMADRSDVEFDLSAISECNSAAVALLMSWYRFAHAQGKSIVYTHAASDLVNIVQVSGLDDVLPLHTDD